MTKSQIENLVGKGAYDQLGKGNINAGDGGIAFIVASAESIPGSPELVSDAHPALSSSAMLNQQGGYAQSARGLMKVGLTSQM